MIHFGCRVRMRLSGQQLFFHGLPPGIRNHAGSVPEKTARQGSAESFLFSAARKRVTELPHFVTSGSPGRKSWTIFLFSRKILSTSNWRIFRVSKGGANSASRKILREKLELHSASKKSLNIAKMVEKRFELPVSTHDLAYEKNQTGRLPKIPIFSDKSENPHARVTGVHKFLTFTPPSVPVDNREASHQEMKPL